MHTLACVSRGKKCYFLENFANLINELSPISETVFYENNHNYNFYKFSYKFAFVPFLSFPRNQKQEPNFQQVGRLAMKNVSDFCL